MGSNFEDEFSGPAAELLAEFGRLGTYKPPSGSEVTDVYVKVEENPANAKVGIDHVTSFKRMAELVVLQSQVTQPVKDGRFTVEGVVWTVISMPVLRNSCWRMDAEGVKVDRIAERRTERA